MKNNKKVPIAILSCFLIAFILQGILKMSGVFIFEKALSWQIFALIDSLKWLQVIYYALLSSIATYCLSFSLTNNPYSKRWYHYIIIISSCLLITYLKLKFAHPMYLEFIYDCILYIIIPVIINLTSKEERIFEKLTVTNIIITVSVHILLYFAYLGLNYWSALLNTITPISQSILYASSNFLIQFEVYIGIVLLMFALNCFIQKIKLKEI